ncbi:MULTISPECIES: hypothetical protein [unclassified Moorena]|uniref:hypothetical protein n=1 Tax=unclassified Moorena TaxID=2683338 RepID=UPI0013FEC00A|nr:MULTISPECIES: hypothetical protein [unclassified Moorena]NEO17188.1 hypothetical protein [Moorena sp. SIO3E8]NEQ03713.1 hypothetical protein [Moorena sp. SIO3F7]
MLFAYNFSRSYEVQSSLRLIACIDAAIAILYYLFPLLCSLFPVPCSLFPTPYSLLPTPYSSNAEGATK